MQQERQEATSPFYREGFGEAESLSPTSHKPHVNATVQIKLSNSKSTTLSIFGQQIQTLLCSLYTFFFFRIIIYQGWKGPWKSLETWNPKMLNNISKVKHQSRIGPWSPYSLQVNVLLTLHLFRPNNKDYFYRN